MEPTFSCIDSYKAGASRKQFTDLVVYRIDVPDSKQEVVWGVDSDHLLDELTYGQVPPHVREFHPPDPLRNKVVYSVRVGNTHDDRGGQRYFGISNGQLIVASSSMPEALADLTRRLGNT
jgi:hypothetical protein